MLRSLVGSEMCIRDRVSYFYIMCYNLMRFPPGAIERERRFAPAVF